jgi:hypothetical protein
MSEGSFWPKRWKEAVPLIVWGVLIFAAGFEGVAALVHGEWISSVVSFVIMLGLTATLLHWKAWLEKVSANWLAGAVTALVVAIALLPTARLGRWPVISWESAAGGVLAALIAIAIIGVLISVSIADGSQANATVAAPSSTEIDFQTRQDIIHLLDFAVNQTTLLWLIDLIMKAPLETAMTPLKIDGNTDSAQKAADFVRHVSVQLGQGTFRRNAFLNWMVEAEAEAERAVEEMPQDQRPAGVDPLILRRCAIANLQCIRASAFLQRERREVEEKLKAQRSRLTEQLRARSPN